MERDYGNDWTKHTQPGPMAHRGRGHRRIPGVARAIKLARKYAYTKTVVTFEYKSDTGAVPRLRITGDHRVIFLDSLDEYRIAEIAATQQHIG